MEGIALNGTVGDCILSWRVTLDDEDVIVDEEDFQDKLEEERKHQEEVERLRDQLEEARWCVTTSKIEK